MGRNRRAESINGQYADTNPGTMVTAAWEADVATNKSEEYGQIDLDVT
jgi:hypothetical protein